MNFLTLLKNRESRSTVAELDQVFKTALDEAAKTEQALERAREAYKESHLAPDPAETVKARAAVADAEVARDRAAALVELAQQRVQEARQREADAARQRRYDEAVQRAASAREALKQYAGLAQQIVDVLETAARGEAAVAAANADLPNGATPLESPEQELRGRPAAPEEVIDESETTGWFYRSTNERVAPELVRSIESKNGRIGTLEDVRRGVSQSSDVIRRRQISKKFLPARGPAFAQPLSQSLRLPSLRPDAAPYWTPVLGLSPEFGDPAAIANATLAAVEACRRQLEAPAPPDPRGERMPQKRVALADIEDELRGEAAE